MRYRQMNDTGLGDDKFGVPVHIFDKNGREQVHIRLNEYHGVKYIDIRTFYRNENDTYLPSKKGVTLRTELYVELLKGVFYLGEMLGFDDETIMRAVED
jgi:hypothetical protein